MPTAPTFSTSVASVWNTTTSPKTTGALSAASGDVLASVVLDENDNGNENYAWSNTGTTQTWTEQAETSGATSGDAWAQTATTVVSGALSGDTISATRSAGSSEYYGILVAKFTATDGIGATARSTGSATGGPSLAITTSYDNSAIFYAAVDFNATDGATRTHRTVNGYTPTAGNGQELAFFRDSIHYSIYVAYIPDAGTAGAKSVGLSAPTGMRYVMAAVEVRGTTGGAPPIPPMLIMPTRRAY